MVVAKTVERGHQRPRVARGAKPQIDLVGVALARARFEHGDEFLHNPGGGHAAILGHFAPVVVDKNEIEVRVIRHLGRAQPAHRKRHQLQRRRNRDARGDVGPCQLQRAAQHDLGEETKLGMYRVGVEVAREIGDRDSQELLVAESANRVEAAFQVRTRHEQRA